MKKITILTFFLLCAMLTFAQKTLHLILISDTSDAKLVKPSLTNQSRMRKCFGRVSKSIGYRLQEHSVMKTGLSYKDIDECLKTVKGDTSDIIIFHYSGHGTNSRTSVFPRFLIHDPKREAQLLALHTRLKKQKTRLVITMADCCNINAAPVKPQKPTDTAFARGEPSEPNWKSLFLHCKGDAIMSSSEPNQFSIYENDMGGYFTTSFTLSLCDETNNKY